MESEKNQKVENLLAAIRNSSATPEEKLDILDALSDLVLSFQIKLDNIKN